MEKTTLYLPRDLHQLLKDAARRSGRPQAELIREALSSYLEGTDSMRPSSIGIGEDIGLSGRESEEWLAQEWDRRSDNA